MSAPAVRDRMAEPSVPLSRLAGLALVRVLVGRVTLAGLGRDLKPLLPQRLAMAGKDGTLEQAVAGLVAGGLCRQAPDAMLEATPEGLAHAIELLGLRPEKPLPVSWPPLRDGPLVALALGLETASQRAQKALGKIDGLRLAIVQQTWALKIRGKGSPSRVRTALALVALERAFGNSVKGSLGAKTDLSPKASRLLAGQLSKTPKDYGTDARLVAALAAEAVGVTKSDLASLRAGVIRRFVDDAEGEKRPQRRKRPASAPAAPKNAPAADAADDLDTIPVADPGLVQTELPAAVHVVPGRPDPERFSAAVRAAASVRADGWPGNRKAFVSQVWSLIQEQHPHWQLSEIEFKSMLTEAHRTGLLVLANADLKDKRYLSEIQASAIAYKNTVWHYIRVEE